MGDSAFTMQLLVRRHRLLSDYYGILRQLNGEKLIQQTGRDAKPQPPDSPESEDVDILPTQLMPADAHGSPNDLLLPSDPLMGSVRRIQPFAGLRLGVPAHLVRMGGNLDMLWMCFCTGADVLAVEVGRMVSRLSRFSLPTPTPAAVFSGQVLDMVVTPQGQLAVVHMTRGECTLSVLALHTPSQRRQFVLSHSDTRHHTTQVTSLLAIPDSRLIVTWAEGSGISAGLADLCGPVLHATPLPLPSDGLTAAVLSRVPGSPELAACAITTHRGELQLVVWDVASLTMRSLISLPLHLTLSPSFCQGSTPSRLCLIATTAGTASCLAVDLDLCRAEHIRHLRMPGQEEGGGEVTIDTVASGSTQVVGVGWDGPVACVCAWDCASGDPLVRSQLLGVAARQRAGGGLLSLETAVLPDGRNSKFIAAVTTRGSNYVCIATSVES